MLEYYISPKDELVAANGIIPIKREKRIKAIIMDESSEVKNVNNGKFFRNEFNVIQLEDVQLNPLCYVFQLYKEIEQLAEEQYLNSLGMKAMAELNNELSKGKKLLPMPIEKKRKVTLSYEAEMLEVATKVAEINDSKGQFFPITFDAYDGIVKGMVDENGKKVGFAKATTAYGIYSYFCHYRLNSSNDFNNMYLGSCFKQKADILKELKVSEKTFNAAEELLILNGWICRKYNNEYGEGKKGVKTYWFVLLKADPTFTNAYSDERTENPDAFGGKYGSNTKHKDETN